MDDRIPRIGSKMTRRWIKPAKALEPTTREALLALFRQIPRIAEAWLVGSRITASDGSEPYETTGIALVLDPPLVGDPEGDRDTMVELIAQLDSAMPVGEERRSWLFVSDTIMRAHQEQASLFYERSGYPLSEAIPGHSPSPNAVVHGSRRSASAERLRLVTRREGAILRPTALAEPDC